MPAGNKAVYGSRGSTAYCGFRSPQPQPLGLKISKLAEMPQPTAYSRALGASLTQPLVKK